MTTTPFDRSAMARRLGEETFDVLVVGGGITGVGVALDAVTRGLRTALVEATDFAAGTSSKSSKLVHGGLRYLQQGEIGLVYEALHERQRLRKNAPHLVELLPFMIPVLTKDGVLSKKVARAFGSALWMYDLTGGWRIGKRHKRISAQDAATHLPTMRTEKLSAAYLYYDATVDDARLCLTVARSAADRGAVVLNDARLVSLPKTADGRIDHAVVLVDGREIVVRTSAVVNATGVWSDTIRAIDEGHDPDTIRPAKGIHLSLPWELVRNDIAVVIPVPGDKRSLFVVPSGPRPDGTFEHTYVGTTDTDYDGPLDDPRCTDDDVQYVLRALNASLQDPVSAADVTGVWAGLRPLVKATDSARTADLSRRHQVRSSDSGVITVTGGKLTTYRAMAEDAVDALMKQLGRKGRCKTRKLRLHGAPGRAAGGGAGDRLVTRYGSDADQVQVLIDDSADLGRPLVTGLPYLRAEAVYAVRHEQARTLDDVLSRRTRARLFDLRATIDAVPDVARLLAAELDWSDEQTAANVEAFVADCAAELTVAEPAGQR